MQIADYWYDMQNKVSNMLTPHDLSLFTLFHHNTKPVDNNFNVEYERIINNTSILLKTYKDIAYTLIDLIKLKTCNFSDQEISITLTGGMDSRLILAFLLKSGIKPNCLTFGNPNTRDVIFAKSIADKFNLPFHNTCHQKPTKEWYYQWVVETIKRDQGNSHLHRAHRTAAIAEHAEQYKPKVLLTGHMGGEGLRGLTYNNYFSSPFFEMVNLEKGKPMDVAKLVLREYFVKQENIDYEQLMQSVNNLSWMKHDREVNKFYYLYDFVARIHHAQDIRLYQSYIPEVIPVYLQKDYLETLFASPYNFLSRNSAWISRLRNPEFYCKVIEEIFPPLMDLPLVNGFSPREYLKGFWYYIPVKMIRDYQNKNKYPPAFSYGQWYVDFVKEHVANINPEMWEVYDKKRYMKALERNNHRTDEGYWHKFSNPIYFDLLKKFHEGKL